jgi:hypothetical protein
MSLTRLLRAVRAITPQAEITFLQVPDNHDLWAIRVAVGGVILLQTPASYPVDAIREAGRKLESLSNRALQVLHQDSDMPPPSSTDE